MKTQLTPFGEHRPKTRTVFLQPIISALYHFPGSHPSISAASVFLKRHAEAETLASEPARRSAATKSAGELRGPTYSSDRQACYSPSCRIPGQAPRSRFIGDRENDISAYLPDMAHIAIAILYSPKDTDKGHKPDRPRPTGGGC